MKTEGKAKKKPNNAGISKGLSSLLSGNFLTKGFVQSNMGFIFFLVAVMIAYISFGYFGERNAKELAESEAYLREMKAANLSVNARLEKLKQQSQVARTISQLGLEESTDPPKVIHYPKENEE